MARLLVTLGVALVLAPAAAAATITEHATTASYKLTLDVGPVEAMYTQAEARSKHPASGEVMLGGSMGGMSGMSGMSMAKGNAHLEVHVLARSSGKVMAVAPSTVALTDTTMGMGMTQKVSPIAMEGVGQGMADLHYGNNVKLTAGHTYRVVVTVKGETASFTFRA